MPAHAQCIYIYAIVTGEIRIENIYIVKIQKNHAKNLVHFHQLPICMHTILMIGLVPQGFQK